jgi:glycosyltransferase involved in cell wall biosynthesis
MDSQQKRIRIALVTGVNTMRKQDSWMMAHGYMTQSLQKYAGDVCNIGPIPLRGTLLMGKILNKLTQLIFKKRLLYYQSFLLSKRYARIASRRLAKLSVDIIIAPAGDAYIPFLATDAPIILIEGASIALLNNYYPQFSHVLRSSLLEADRLQALALQKASFILNPSRWGVNSLLEDYHTDPQKVAVLPYGANISNPPSLETILAKQRSDRCRLLFVATDWHRKGGAIAFETLLKLEERGLMAELIVCGCVPPASFSHRSIKVIPFLDKSDVKQYQELQQLFLSADFFFLPTRQELFGFVFSEASAFGLPSITTDSGGVSGAITNGENGYMLPLDAGGAEYANVIADLYQDEERYTALVRSSRKAFEERLNWDTWALAVNEIICRLLAKKAMAQERVHG